MASIRLCCAAVLALTVSITAAAANGRFHPGAIFGDNMVLTGTAETPAAVYGAGSAAGTTVTVTLTNANTTDRMAWNTTTSADAGFGWRVQLIPTPPPGTDIYTIELSESGSGATATTYTAQNVVFGYVFLCSGQSNMEFPVQGTDTAVEILQDASNRANIKLLATPDDNGIFPEEFDYHPQAAFYPSNYSMVWTPATNTTALSAFSAICYMAATEVMDLHTKDIPLGLILAAKGGTPVEGWGTEDVFNKCQLSHTLPIPIQSGDMNSSNSNVNTSTEFWSHPGTLYNQKIGPLLGTTLTSALWYQGEANMNEGFHLSRHNYFCLFRQMIIAWRKSFAMPNLPFNLVQLHACDDGNNGQCYADFCNYGDIRMAHDDAQRFLDGVGMAVSYDHGHQGIHSPHKAEVGRRLGLKVLSTAFGQDVPEDGPIVSGACVKTPPTVSKTMNITAITVQLKNVKQLKLVPTDECSTQSPTCCNGTQPGLPGTAYGIAQIAVGNVFKGQQWYDATMAIGEDGQSVVFTSDLKNEEHLWGEENDPVWQVRFALGAFPSCALMNENGIPLQPFGPLAVSPACSWNQTKSHDDEIESAFRPTSIFGDGLVLTSTNSTPAALYGTGSMPGTSITVTLTKSTPGSLPTVWKTSTGTDLRWDVQLTPTPRPGTDTFSVEIKESGSGASARVYTASNVVFGFVFLCSGQSNMEFPVQSTDTAKEILADAVHRGNIRLLATPDDKGVFPEAYNEHPVTSFYPSEYELNWVPASNTTALATFSAICYMAATHVMDSLTKDVPIGLILAAKGGTPVEGWGTPEVYDLCDVSYDLPIPIQSGDMNSSDSKLNISKELWSHPGTLYNQKIGPLLGTTLTSVLWYQGEANSNEGFHLSRHNYFCFFRQMIVAWRKSLNISNLTFNFVQLHACGSGNTGQCFEDFCSFGDIRMAQDDTERFLDGVGMAVSYDHAHSGIHSPHKAEVGRRLGLKVLSNAFGQDVRADGPIVAGTCVKTPPTVTKEVNITAVTVQLTNVQQLKLVPTDECSKQSPICCNGTQTGLPGTAYGIAQIALGNVWKGQQWYDATMTIGSDGQSVIFTSDLLNDNHPWGQEDDPVWQIRFAHGMFPSCALVNENGIPLAPFGPLAVSPACSFSNSSH